MGLFGKAVRRSVPRSVRKPYRAVRHPVRSAMPRQVKSVTRVAYNVTNPINALGNAAEDAALGLTRFEGSGGARSRAGASTAPGRAPSQATLDREAAYRVAVNEVSQESNLRSRHLATSPPAHKRVVPGPIATSEDAMRPEFYEKFGVHTLDSMLSAYGDPPSAPEPKRPDPHSIAVATYKHSASGIPVWNRKQKRAAWAAALAHAEAQADQALRDSELHFQEISGWISRSIVDLETRKSLAEAALRDWCRAESESRQSKYETACQEEAERWNRLITNDPSTTCESVDVALRTRSLGASCLLADDGGLVIYATVGELDDWVLDAEPALTPSGKPTVKKRTKTARNRLYLAEIVSTILAVAQCAFGAAPAAKSVSILAGLDDDDDDALAGLIAVATMSPATIEMLKSANLWSQDPDILAELPNCLDHCELNISGRAAVLAPLNPEHSNAVLAIEQRLSIAHQLGDQIAQP